MSIKSITSAAVLAACMGSALFMAQPALALDADELREEVQRLRRAVPVPALPSRNLEARPLIRGALPSPDVDIDDLAPLARRAIPRPVIIIPVEIDD